MPSTMHVTHRVLSSWPIPVQLPIYTFSLPAPASNFLLIHPIMEAPPISPNLVTHSCRSSRCRGKSYPLNHFRLKKDGQLSSTCIACAEKEAAYKHKSRVGGKMEKDEGEGNWTHIGLDAFLENIAEATEKDIDFRVLLDTSDIIGVGESRGDRARAIAEAFGVATVLHWT